MEGQALVHQRLHHYRDFEYRFKRYLEDDGNTIRLVTIFKNLIAGMIQVFVCSCLPVAYFAYLFS